MAIDIGKDTMTRDELNEILEERGASAVVLDDLDSAIVGLYTDGEDFCHVVYSKEKIIDALVTEQDMSYEDAVQWYEYNTLRAIPYAGKSKPIVIETGECSGTDELKSVVVVPIIENLGSESPTCGEETKG